MGEGPFDDAVADASSRSVAALLPVLCAHVGAAEPALGPWLERLSALLDEATPPELRRLRREAPEPRSVALPLVRVVELCRTRAHYVSWKRQEALLRAVAAFATHAGTAALAAVEADFAPVLLRDGPRDGWVCAEPMGRSVHGRT